MKVGIVGVGYVGTSCAKSMLLRGSCSAIVLIDKRDRDLHTQGVRNDLIHCGILCPANNIVVGTYKDLTSASVVVVTAGINEKQGEAIDPEDPWGRQLLLPKNSAVFEEVIPKIVQHVPDAPILIVTDPPDTLADVARDLVQKSGGKNQVISAGTLLDTNRFRFHIAERLGLSSTSVDAYVLAEHGNTKVYEWSQVRVGGVPIEDVLPSQYTMQHLKDEVREDVQHANIAIIRATDASQHGIGIATARIVEAILRDENLVLPVGIYHAEFGVTLSLPSVVGRAGATRVMRRTVRSLEERKEFEAVQASATYLAEALHRSKSGQGYNEEPGWSWHEYSKKLRGEA